MPLPVIVALAVAVVVAAWWVSRLGQRGPREPHESSSLPRTASPENLRALVAAGQKIQAIKLLREQSGLGLKEAKDAIDAFERGEPMTLPTAPPSPAAVPGDASAEIERLIRADRDIQAIKLYRERTGAGLKESKDAIDLIRARMGK